MKKFSLIPLALIAFFTSSCDSTKSVSNNTYNDGIYYNPETDDRGFTLSSIEDPEENITTNPDASAEGYESETYVNPNDQYFDNNNNVVINNYYNSPTLRTPGWNTGLYWNSWGGWGMSMGYNWGWGGYYYDPFFYDPWYNPYWYRPIGYYGYCRPWTPGWGYYNSYWAGFYNGYYYGGNDVAIGGRNRTYTGYVPVTARTNAYNSRNRASVSRKSYSTDRNTTITRSRSATRGDNDSRTATPGRASENNRAVTSRSSRLADANLRRNTGEIAANISTNRGREYSNDTYEYVKSRSASENVRTRPATTRNSSTTPDTRSRNTDINRGNTNTRDNNLNNRTRSISKDEYFNRSDYGRDQSNSRKNSGERDIYVPSQDRSRTYERNDNTRINNRSSTPSRSNDNNSRSRTPSRSNNTYTPSPSRDNSRNYTPSPSMDRSYTPSRSSSGGTYSAPSRSGGSSRSSGSMNRSSGRR